MIAAAAVAALVAAAPAIAQQAPATLTRVNPSECPAPDAEVNLAALAAELGPSATECSGPDSCEFKVATAEDFEIEYFPDFKVVTNTHSQPPFISVLYPCGREQPTGPQIQAIQQRNSSGVIFLEIPLHAVATGDSTAAAALEAIGVADRVKFAGQFVTSPCLVQLSNPEEPDPLHYGDPEPGCGMQFYDDSPYYEYEPTPMSEFDVEFSFLGSAENKTVPFTSPADPSPLARMEHLAYMAAFFNKEAAAAAEIANVTQAFEAAIVAQPPADAPTILFITVGASLSDVADSVGNPVEGSGHLISYAPYKTALIRDAGGALVPQADAQAAVPASATAESTSESAGPGVIFADALFESPAAAGEAFKSVLAMADVVIDEGFAAPANKTAFMEALNITEAEAAEYPFLVNDQIYSPDLAQSNRGSNDWFGSSVFRPDVVLADMKNIVSGGPPGQRTYLRNVAAGQQPMYITGAECEAECGAFAAQEPIPLGMPSDTGAGGGGGEGEGTTLGGGGLTGETPSPPGSAGWRACAGAAAAAAAMLAALA